MKGGVTMYTLLINENNEIVTTVRERIMQRSKLVDDLHFLMNPMYKGIDMSDFTVMMEYLMPLSREYKTEILVKSNEMYKGQIEYKLPFDTCLTKEHGDIEVQLTFIKVSLDADGNTKQQVRKAGPATIKIVPISAWSDIVPDSALSALDQRLIMIDAQMNGINEFVSSMYNTQVDDLSYDKDECALQLTSHGVGVGSKVSIKDIMEDGIPVVDLNSDGYPGNDDVVKDDEDNVVEF